MMVYFSFIIIPECVHVGVYQHHNEGVEQVKQEPDIHHLHVGGLWKIVAYVDEHCSQHQHGGQIYSDDSLLKIHIKLKRKKHKV